MAQRVWSGQQEDIFNWFAANDSSNLVVVARAGTGKTTTIIEGILRAPEPSILLCAFNKKIATELNARITANGMKNATAKTLHAIGFAIVQRFRSVTVGKGSDRADKLTDDVCGNKAPDAIKKLISKLHTLGREIAPHAKTPGQLTDIAIAFECEPDEAWAEQGFGLDYVEQAALDAMELASQIKSGGVIDYSDMIFLPVRNGWISKQYDLVVVDEAQDMTTAQLEIAQGVCRGRVCVVGDDMQAIYGFRGADSGSLGRLKTELAAQQLGLNTTYRCGKAIVREAQRFVSDFVAGDDNGEGEILHMSSEHLTNAAMPGDFILSRVNAPLVSIAMKLLRSGKRTRVAGRDIGAGLISLIKKLKGRSVPDMLSKISAWESRELTRLNAQMPNAKGSKRATLEAKIAGVLDQSEMLTSLSDGARNVDEMIARIEALFTDDGLGDAGVIVCSSVHKSKGLEADRVFVLASTLRTDSQDECNISYVAITRAKNTLVYVR